MIQRYSNLKSKYKNEPPAHTEAKRVGRFGVIGVMNTAIDFVVYNTLSSLGLGLYVSNVFSTTCAMIFSFLANKHVVFHDHDHDFARQTIKFFASTAFALWVIQSGVIKILTSSVDLGAIHLSWHAPIAAGLALAHAVGVGHFLSDDFMTKNGAKVFGILCSMTWNYFMYRNVVFTKRAER